MKENLLPLLPEEYQFQLSSDDWQGLEELRLGIGRPLRLRYGQTERELWPALTADAVDCVLQRACRHSAYAYTDTIRRGYVTVEGGHRIGICGFGVAEGTGIQTLTSISSLNIRVARQVIGCANKLFPVLRSSTLLIGPPGSGKTTLLRDAIRLLSDKGRQYVGLADERGEVSAATTGVARLSVGSRTDILVSVPKAQAMMMLLRTMNPDWIALDEITASEDIQAMEQASYCGVNLLATAHGASMDDLACRPLYQKLMQTGVFRQVVVLHKDKSYTIEEVR